MVRKLWNDPVWSKVIAGLITAVVLAVGAEVMRRVSPGTLTGLVSRWQGEIRGVVIATAIYAVIWVAVAVLRSNPARVPEATTWKRKRRMLIAAEGETFRTFVSAGIDADGTPDLLVKNQHGELRIRLETQPLGQVAFRYMNPSGGVLGTVIVLTADELIDMRDHGGALLKSYPILKRKTVEPNPPSEIEPAATPHEEIRFDYLPASPLQNGWEIGYFDKRVNKDDRAAVADYLKSRRWVIAPDSPTEGSIIIDIDNCAMDHNVSPNAALSQRMEFEANYIDSSAMVFVRVLLATRDDRQTTTKLIKFVLGRKKPYRTPGYEDFEYTVEINPPSLGKGWRKIILSLPDETDRSWGQDGWYYKELRTIRLRGKLSISPIRLY
jgi:hypothetical protein